MERDPSEGSVSHIETSGDEEIHQEQPWEGRFLPRHPDEETSDFMCSEIMETLDECAYGRGLVASELADETARRLYEKHGEVVFGSGDIKVETSKMWGNQIRMAPDRTLHPK